MGIRNKFPRGNKNPLLVSAKAITRACDPREPSRITVLRLLGDALHIFQESQLVVNDIKERASSFTSRETAVRLPPGQLDSDARIRAGHEQGARALFTAVATVLIKLPSRAGPLRRRAIDLIRLAGKAAGPAVVLQSVEKMRDHILGLKRLTWSDNERGDFEVVCAIMTLAELSSCTIAGRDVAKDSIVFLLSPRVRQKCRRSDLALAIAMIVQSFPAHAPPDDRLVDQMLEFCLSPSTLKQGTAGAGSALLAAVSVPHLVSRGPASGDEVTAACGRALRSAPVATERAMWCVAMARSAVTARRSTTYQLRKYGNSEAGTRFPSNGNSFASGPLKFEKDPEDSNPKVWVSNDTFEEALVQVSNEAGLREGRVDSFVAVACVLRMWGQALPESIPTIVQRTFSRLLPELTLASAVSALVDGIWLGVLKDLKPSQSAAVLDNLLSSLSVQNVAPLSAALHVFSLLLMRHRRQCLRESGLSTDYNSVTVSLIKRAHEALEVSSNMVRMGGVHLMAGLLAALPRTCSQFLTAVLQNMRIADLTLASKERSLGDLRTFGSISFIEQELSAILGNACALSVLMARIYAGHCSVPAALVRQCAVDSIALLRPHQAGDIEDSHGVIAASIRRRAGWGLIGALACGKQRVVFEGEYLSELLSLWKEELGYSGKRDSRRGILNTTFAPTTARPGVEQLDEAQAPTFDELSALSSTRSAALRALFCALKHVHSDELAQCAKGLMGACAARIVATHSGLNTPTYLGHLISQGIFEGGTILDLSGEKKKNLVKLAKLLHSEAAHVTECLTMVPPDGDPAELCYYVAVGLGDEAQKVLGELEHSTFSDSVVMKTGSPSERNSLVENGITNHRLSMGRSLLDEQFTHAAGIKAHPSNCRSYEDSANSSGQDADVSWIFSMHGVGTLDAETTLASSASAVAAIIAEDLTRSGFLIESLLSAKLSPCSSALIALGIVQRLSRSDLAEINRALAVLQVLAKRALAVTGGIQRTVIYESKNGRLYDPNSLGDGYRLGLNGFPGFELSQTGGSNEWMKWACTFSEEGQLRELPFHDFHTRGIGIMYATKLLAAQAHRELGTTGGPLVWKGLMRRVIAAVKENSGGLSSSQAILLSSSIAALGALLEVMPEPGKSLLADQRECQDTGDLSGEVDDIVDEAVGVLADTLEKGSAAARTAAALALSNCSNRVASASERIIGALLRAWAQDSGEFSALGHAGRCMNEVVVWTRCFAHIWKDMGIKSAASDTRFFAQDSSGQGGCSPALAIGATAVLSSCRLNWWTLTEASYYSITELATELLQWSGTSSRNARAAGLHSMTSLWTSRIDAARTRRLSEAGNSFASLDSFPANRDCPVDPAPLLPVQSFSLKEQTRIESAVGPYLDEVLYEALAPYEYPSHLDGLQRAAVAAVMEVIRGAGVRETCKNLPRLPECLIATVEYGSRDAEVLLEILAQCDGRERPKYWFGLCRAVCLSGDRLNYGGSKVSWDVSYHTKAVSIRTAKMSVDSSVSNCRCDVVTVDKFTKGLTKHVCAYGFLGKIVAFALEVSRNNSFDFICCGEACKLLQRLAAKIGSRAAKWSDNDSTIRDFREEWDSCFSSMEELLVDGVPHIVVSNAGLAVSELLALFLRLSGTEYFQSAQGKVISYLSKSAGYGLRARFMYSDQGEEVGLQATLAAVSRYAKIMSALRATTHGGEAISNSPTRLRVTRMLIFSVLGDFASTLNGQGLEEIARFGGSLTSGLIGERILQNAMNEHIVPIVLGAVSCIGLNMDLDGETKKYSWTNANSAGVRVAEGGQKYDLVAVGCLLWLLKRGQGESVSIIRKQLMDSQCQEALTSLCLSNAVDIEDIREVLLSYADLSTERYLLFADRLSQTLGIQKLAKEVAEVVIVIALTLVREVANDELNPNSSEKARIVCAGLQGITSLLGLTVEGRQSISDAVYAQSLDTVFQIASPENEAATDLFSNVQFQEALFEYVRTCLQRLQQSSKLHDIACRKVKDVFAYGLREGSLPYVRLSFVLGSLLSSMDIVGARLMFMNMLLTPVRTEAHKAPSETSLEVGLGCYGVEDELLRISGLIQVPSDDSSLEEKGKSHAWDLVVRRLAEMGLSKEASSVLPGLRISSAMMGKQESNIGSSAGVLLYSILLPMLAEVLPMASDNDEHSRIGTNRSVLVDLAKREPNVFNEVVALLPEKQRNIIDSLMKHVEEGKKI